MKNRLIGFAVSCAVVVACSSSSGGGSGGGGDGGGGLTAQQACTDLANARCSKLESCSAIRVSTAFANEPDCVGAYTTSCTTSLAAPSQGNTAAQTESCSQAYANWDCTDFLNDANIPAACGQQKGSVATGQACAFPGQCQTGFCAIVPAAACGVCAAPPVAAQSCADLTTCGPGLTCTTDTQECVVLAASGASCGKGAPCGSGLVCIGEDDAKNVMGMCQMGITTMGTACDPTDEKGPGCSHDAGLTCNSATKTCQPISVNAVGGDCGTVMNQTADCGASATCVGATSKESGKCVAPANDGSACTPPNPSCAALSRCIGKAAVGDAGASGTCETQSASNCM
jgi:hypothetical protein